jgi:hypothetical protein
MIRRLSILFFMVIFGASAWIGFGLTSELSKTKLVAETPSPAANQSNILIVGLENDLQGQPHLVSAWVALIRAGDRPSLIFKKIYPDLKNASDRSEIQAGFPPVNGNKLPDSFEQKITGLRLQITGRLMVERNNLSSIGPYFGGKVSPGLTFDSHKGNDSTAEANYLKSLCKSLTDAAALPTASGSTGSAGASHWMDPWKGLVTSLRFSSCTVLVDP